jgi:predicted adenylyl cyclase CyaB
MTPRRNLEIKARLDSLDRARCVAQEIATQDLGVELQTDTYFRCPIGRLKLREIAGRAATLIAYARPDAPGPKPSDYHLIPVADAVALAAGLDAALGVKQVVRKRREIHLVDNVRIHLDEVDGLGTFIEFEAVIVDDATARDAPEQVERLIAQFGIQTNDLVSGSYAEMAARDARRIAEAPQVQ